MTPDPASFWLGMAAGVIILMMIAALVWAVLETNAVDLVDLWRPLRRVRRPNHTHTVAIEGMDTLEAALCLRESCGEIVMVRRDPTDASSSVEKLAELLESRGARRRD